MIALLLGLALAGPDAPSPSLPDDEAGAGEVDQADAEPPPSEAPAAETAAGTDAGEAEQGAAPGAEAPPEPEPPTTVAGPPNPHALTTDPHPVTPHRWESVLEHVEHERHLPLWESPGRMRRTAAALGVSSILLGSVWFLQLGDSLGAGDPASLLTGSGVVLVSGAVLGSAVTSYRGDEGRLDLEAGRATFGASYGPEGTNTLGETAPSTLALTAAPRFTLARTCAEVLPSGSLSSDMGWARAVDPRPQLEGSAVRTALEERHTSVEGAIELRVAPGCYGHLFRRQLSQFKLITEVRVLSRWERYVYGNVNVARDLRRTMLTPVNVGVRWHVSGRQRFTVVLGPSWHRIAWSSPAGFDSPLDPSVVDGQRFVYGPLYGAFSYDIHDSWQHWHPMGADVSHRLGVSYVHSNFDGSGVNLGAVIGFFGPMYLRYDVAMSRPGARWALQTGLRMELGEDTSAVFSVGLRPAEREDPR